MINMLDEIITIELDPGGKNCYKDVMPISDSSIISVYGSVIDMPVKKELSITDFCIAKKLKKLVDPITGEIVLKELVDDDGNPIINQKTGQKIYDIVEVPEYHLSPTLAAETIRSHSKLAISEDQKDNPNATIYYWHECQWVANAESIIEHIIDGYIGDLGYAKGYSEMFRRLRAEIPKLKFDADLNIICLKNGRYNWRTKEFIAHSPNDPYPSLIKYPIEYDPKATCPNIDLIIEKLTPNKVHQKSLKEWAAYCFYRSYLLKKSLMAYGPTGTGKSIFTRLLDNMIGKDNSNSLSLDRLTYGRFDLSELKGKSRNNCGETPATEIKAFNNFKCITGNDPINSDVKYKDPIRFHSFAKIEMMLNELFKTKDKTDAFYTRFLIILFLHHFTDEEKIRDAKLMDFLEDPKELSGFFNECMALLPDLIDRKAFTYNPSAYEIEKLFNQLSEPIEEFVDKFVVQCSDDENKKVGKEYLYGWFETFSILNRTKADKKEFTKFIKSLDCVKMYRGPANNCKKRYGNNTQMAWPNLDFNKEAWNKYYNITKG